jgi:hypothetical protein
MNTGGTAKFSRATAEKVDVISSISAEASSNPPKIKAPTVKS